MRRNTSTAKPAQAKRPKQIEPVSPRAPGRPEKPPKESAVDPQVVAIHVGPRILYEPLLVSVEEAAQLLGGISRVTVFALFNEGELRKVKVKGRTMVAFEDLRAYVARQLGEAS